MHWGLVLEILALVDLTLPPKIESSEDETCLVSVYLQTDQTVGFYAGSLDWNYDFQSADEFTTVSLSISETLPENFNNWAK